MQPPDAVFSGCTAKPLQQSAGQPLSAFLGVTTKLTTDSMVSVSDEIRLASTNPQGLLWMSLAPQARQVVPISAKRGRRIAEQRWLKLALT